MTSLSKTTCLRSRSSRLLALFLLAAAVTLAGCDAFGKEGENEISVAEGVVVGNAGNFSAQSGSLTAYDPQTKEKGVAARFGALLQSQKLRGNRLYVVLNNDASTGRIDVLRAGGSFARLDQILFPRPPRAIAFEEDEGEAYVPAQTLDETFTPVPSVTYVVNLSAAAIVDSVAVGRQPEDAEVIGQKAFVANYGSLGDGRTLTVIATNTEEAVGTVSLGCDGPNELFEDGEGQLVVICQGKTVYGDYPEIEEQTPGQVLFVDPATGTVTHRLRYDVQLGAAHYAEESEVLSVAGSGNRTVFRVDTDANAKAGSIEVPASESLSGLAAVAYDAASGRLYVARRDAANPFTAAGTVLILSATGDGSFEKTGQFVVGVAPADITLLRN